MCRMREEIMSLQDRIEEIEKTRTFKNEIFSDLKKHNKHLFILCVIIFTVLVALVGYIIYLTNDIGKTTQSIEIDDFEHIDNSHIKIGDDVWEKLN